MGRHHGHDHREAGPAVKNIRLAFFLNFGFAIVEFVGGWWTNSVAIMSDALHDLGDTVSLGLAWGLEILAGKRPTRQFSYGFRRFSLLGALINALILLSGSILILSEVIPRLLEPETAHAPGMLALALLGVAVNGFAVWRTSRGKSLNERVISLHLWEDVLGWLMVLVVSVVMLFADIPVLDPILSLLITLYILWGVGKNLKETASLFLQSVPGHLSVADLERRLLGLPPVVGIHDTHLWSLDGEKHIFSAHLIVRAETSKMGLADVKEQARTTLREAGVEHSTLELEFPDEDCRDYCD